MKRTIIVSLVGILCLGIGITTWFVFSPNKRVDTNSAPVILETNTSYQSNSLSAGTSPVLGKDIPGLPEYCADKLISATDCEGMTEITSEQSHTYKLVEIGEQCWFADNLKEIPKAEEGWYGYYNNSDNESSPGDGMLYTWIAAMNGEESENSQGVCPNGWHIPSVCELLEATDAKPTGEAYFDLTRYWNINEKSKEVFSKSGKLRSWRSPDREIVFADGEGERIWTSTQHVPFGSTSYPISAWFMKPRVIGDLRTMQSDNIVAFPLKCIKSQVSS